MMFGSTGLINRLQTKAIANSPAIANIVVLYNVVDGLIVPSGICGIKLEIVTVFAEQ